MKILVVDDEIDARNLFNTVLTDEGYNVFLASGAKEALGLIQNNSFNLVITDINMPVMDGLQLLHEIRKMKLSTDVIMVTGFGEVDSYLKAMNLGAADFIIKPVRVNNMRQIVQNVLTRQRVRSEEALPAN